MCINYLCPVVVIYVVTSLHFAYLCGCLLMYVGAWSFLLLPMLCHVVHQLEVKHRFKSSIFPIFVEPP